MVEAHGCSYIILRQLATDWHLCGSGAGPLLRHPTFVLGLAFYPFTVSRRVSSRPLTRFYANLAFRHHITSQPQNATERNPLLNTL